MILRGRSMGSENPNTLYKILNIWFTFMALLLFSSYLPHWQNVTFHTWINEALYFFLFLIAMAILLKGRYNKDIYINLSLFLLVYSFSFLNIFIGDDYLLGSDRMMYYIYIYKQIVLSLFANFVIIYTVIKYLIPRQKTWVLYAIALGILMTAFVFRFLPYLRNPNHIFSLDESLFPDLHKRLLPIFCISLVFIGIYSYFLFIKDRILGTHISLLMAFFFIFLVSDIVGSLSEIYHFQIFSIGLYVCTINLMFLIAVLLRKLMFLSSVYGQFYEALIYNQINMGKLKIQRHRSQVNSQLLRFLKHYFFHRRNYLFSMIFVTAILLFYFQFPTFFTINLSVLLLCILILFCFINALYKRRAKQKYRLP